MAGLPGRRGGWLALRILFGLAFAAGLLGDASAGTQGRAGILILGDSNSEGPFGGTLYDALRALRDPVSGAPLKVSIFAKCGAGANDWTSRDYARIDCGAWACDDGRALSACRHFMGGSIPPLARLYDELGAERRVTLLVLGLNMIIGNRAEKLRDADRLMAAIRALGSACIWVGPPQPGDLFVDPAIYERFVADLKRTVVRGGCRYIASDDKTDRRDLGRHTRDDHYSRQDAIRWARKVLEELARPVDRDDKPLLALFAP
ncbi:MAG: hypothetical protein WDM91_03010 [Rhizomicrobium sp.]